MRRLVRVVAIGLLIGAYTLAVAPARQGVLRGIGRILVASDGARPSDLLVMDVASGAAGVLTIADLHRSQPGATVGGLVPRATLVDAELRRRGIVLPDLTLEMLAQLGIPREAIALDSGRRRRHD